MGGSGLGERLEALIGLIVAGTLWAPYPGVHHAQRLLSTGVPLDQVGQLVRDPMKVRLGEREHEAIRFCEQLTRAPSAMSRADVESLRAVGFNDYQIITLVASASLADFTCRVAAGLGVQLESDVMTPVALETFQVGATATASS